MKICIIGTGYVGLVSAACFAESGNDVICVDVNQKIVDLLNSGSIHIYEPGLEELVRRNTIDCRLSFTTSLKTALKGAVCAFICVGTPSRDGGSCDLSHVYQVAREIGENMSCDLIIVDKSTVPVGTADKVKELINLGLQKRQANFRADVVSNPEFLKEGDAISDFMKPDRVVIGSESSRATEVMRTLYTPFARSREKILVMGTRSAEMTKYAANSMLATKISFINEIANICERVGADVRDVRTGIGSDSRIGYQFIYPGLGYGGSCFPKDVKALIHTAKESGITPFLLQAVEEVNKRQKQHMAEVIEKYFEPQGGVKGKLLGVWGLAFKANTDDMREAASVDIIRKLAGQGMRIKAFDPVAANNAATIFADDDMVEISREQYSVCDGADALLVATEWNQFRNPDFVRISGLLNAPIIFDGRNLYSPKTVGKAGFAYFCVGRPNPAA